MALYGSKSVELQIAVTEVLERIAKEEVNRSELTERGVRGQGPTGVDSNGAGTGAVFRSLGGEEPGAAERGRHGNAVDV